MKSFSLNTGVVAWNFPTLVIYIIIRIYNYFFFKSRKLPAVYSVIFSSFKKSVLKLFYDSHFSTKRAFTLEKVVAWAGKNESSPFFHNVWSSGRKDQVFSVRLGSLFEVQLVVCCSHRRRKTEALPPLLSPSLITLLPNF